MRKLILYFTSPLFSTFIIFYFYIKYFYGRLSLWLRNIWGYRLCPWRRSELCKIERRLKEGLGPCYCWRIKSSTLNPRALYWYPPIDRFMCPASRQNKIPLSLLGWNSFIRIYINWFKFQFVIFSYIIDSIQFRDNEILVENDFFFVFLFLHPSLLIFFKNKINFCWRLDAFVVSCLSRKKFWLKPTRLEMIIRYCQQNAQRFDT